MGSWKPQIGKEWLPSDSPDRELVWKDRIKPFRLTSHSWKSPTNFAQCFNCFEEAIWCCAACELSFCRFEECKGIHEYEHSLSRLAGPDE